jgi:competence protein ComEC
MILGVVVMTLAALNSILCSSQLLEQSIFYLNKIINSIASFEQFIIHDIPLHYSVMVSSFVITTAIVWIKPTFNKLALMLIAIITVQICCLSKQWKYKMNKN